MDHFAKIAQALAANGLDAVLLTRAHNRFYASGFRTPDTDGVALCSRRGNYYFTDSRYTEAAIEAVGGATVKEIGKNHGYSDYVNEIARDEGLHTIGYDDEFMTVAEHRVWTEKLEAELVPASHILRALRERKDEEELSRLTAAQRIAERALNEILNDLREGVTEKAIAAKLQYLMLSYGAEGTSFDPIVASGANGSRPHAVPTEKPLRRGEFVTMDFGCVYRGYCSDMTRTVAIGEVTDEMRQVYETVLAAQKAGIAAARAGVSGKAVDGAARAVIEKAGYGKYFGHSFGHGVGVEIHESPNASPSNDLPLPIGAVISAEPGIYLPARFGVRIEDVIVITENGCEDLTLAPKELLIL